LNRKTVPAARSRAYFEKVTFIPATFARAIRTDGELRSGCLPSPDERQSQ
jgi:hypothetical protein